MPRRIVQSEVSRLVNQMNSRFIGRSHGISENSEQIPGKISK